MANTFTNFIAPAFAALNVVSRELVGIIPAVSRNMTADRVAKDQTLYSPAAPVNTTSTITPAATLTAASDQTIASKSLTISAFKKAAFNWTGEEQNTLNSGGPGTTNILQDQFAQAFRVLVNGIESLLYTTAAAGASRAYGTATTTPFASNLTELANVRKILDDNGTPLNDRQLVINTTAGVNLRTLSNLFKANEAASDDLLRRGVLLDLFGFAIRESAQISAITKGTAASATTDNAGYAVGSTTLTLASAGTGTLLAGDVVTFAGDTNKYVIASGDSDVSNGGTITLQSPGLLVAMSAATKAITVHGNITANLAFSRDAVVLATRLPAVPQQGDLALMREVVTDPVSGLSFEIAIYPGYRMVTIEVGIAYGAAVFNPEHLAILLG